MKIHRAKIEKRKEVEIWGSGEPLREFLYVDDLADVCVFLMNSYEEKELINVGSGKEISIRNLSSLLKEVIEFDGEIVFDRTKPDGMMRKLLDCSKINSLGWKPKIDFRTGLKIAYEDYVNRLGKI
jgi:GDP-L-fucose synthase